jgi:hypothetical protein
LFTLNITGWGTREGVSNELAADIEKNGIAAAVSVDGLSQTTIQIPPEEANKDKMLAKVNEPIAAIVKADQALAQPTLTTFTWANAPAVISV